MPKKAVRALISGGVIIVALFMLFYMTARDGAQFYKKVDEVAGEQSKWYGKNMQLHGYAQAVTIAPNTLHYKFDIQNNGQVIHASYTGVVPDTFKDGAEVVIKGRLGPNGFDVEPNGVTAKCPSRYVASGSAGQSGQ